MRYIKINLFRRRQYPLGVVILTKQMILLHKMRDYTFTLITKPRCSHCRDVQSYTPGYSSLLCHSLGVPTPRVFSMVLTTNYAFLSCMQNSFVDNVSHDLCMRFPDEPEMIVYSLLPLGVSCTTYTTWSLVWAVIGHLFTWSDNQIR